MADNEQIADDELSYESYKAHRQAPQPDPTHIRKDEKRINIHQYVKVALKHKWGIVSLTLVAAIIAYLYAASLEPKYKALAMLEFTPQTQDQGTVKESSFNEFERRFKGERIFNTQSVILKSRDFAERVVDRLELWNHPYFDPENMKESRATLQIDWLSYLPDWMATLLRPTEPVTSLQTKETLKVQALAMIQGGIEFEHIENTMLYRFGFNSNDPDFAAEMANKIANLFIEFDLESRLDSYKNATQYLTDRTMDLKASINESEKKLLAFREKEKIVNLESGSSILGRQMEDAFNNLTDAQKNRITLEKIVKDIDRLRELPFNEAVNHPSLIEYENIKEAKREELDSELEIAQLAKRYGPKHPKMIAAKAGHQTRISRMKKEVDIVLNNIDKEFERAQWLETKLQKQFDDLKLQAHAIDSKQAEYRALERNLGADQKLYDTFLTRFKETNISSGNNTPNARIIDEARVPGGHYWPNLERIVVIASLGGLFLGLLLAFLLDYINDTLKNSQDIEEKIGIATLGNLQVLKSDKSDLSPERMYIDDQKSLFSESIRTIRTGVLLTFLDSPDKVVAVTSSVPGEGKTTVSINLAVALGQLEKILLIDADMRRASLGPYFGIEKNTPGLSDLVAGTEEEANCIHHNEDAGIDILPAGMIPPNPQELLSSQRFSEALQKLASHYDRVIIDTAPTQLVSDAILVANQASGVIYVIKAESTPYHLVKEGVKRLHQVDSHIIGGVLNQMHQGASGYGGYYKYGKYRNYDYTY
ncbi:hypothetical protein BOW35_09980 [Solemya velum gill symbiont]|uniref:GumC family protein n=1 Tax=Solemya velum gill symbiont TaxID=2340 RepID=UPI0009981ED5|nr:polysaccharide biosynthesis tyrosine autokinase [Solemya velum gill symbiont]OOZ13803.1 hypothetical protein BOW27_08980 [Solemya velum gill symbiont]OOZ19088.1 hypothetical protein BOW29_08895 [Solemya velum gill symbiont]OOZ21489.1 hypothetical protein BOW30_09495 [Solemya velum gill symbiont]OOZ23563.1 hypothetical protein BOW31_09530 [Solemya velum gill symbiont]OOZ28653.1 hypothetical protein BOW33_09535 [Solemya velum gill symbiont]